MRERREIGLKAVKLGCARERGRNSFEDERELNTILYIAYSASSKALQFARNKNYQAGNALTVKMLLMPGTY